MTKRELIEALEKSGIPDDYNLSIHFYYFGFRRKYPDHMSINPSCFEDLVDIRKYDSTKNFTLVIHTHEHWSDNY